MIKDGLELIKVSFERFNFGNVDYLMLFFSALKIETFTYVKYKKLRKGINLYFSQATYEQIYKLIEGFGGKTHWA